MCGGSLPCPHHFAPGEVPRCPTHEPCHAEIERLLARVAAAEERIDQMADVPCVREWGKRPMQCLPKDPCSFCRARTFMAGLRGEGERK